MGQQQLLLLILSAIIVGIAIVTGIQMFGENAEQANQDAITQDILTIASRAQGFYRRPAMMGGGGRSFAAVNLDTLNFTPDTVNIGQYTLTPAAQTLQIQGTGKEGVTITVTVYPDSIGAPTISKN